MFEEPLSVRLRESLRVFPVRFQGPASPIRESVRPFRGVATAVVFPFEGVLEGHCALCRALETFTAPALRGLKAALPPRLRFRKNAKRFCQALEMLGRRRNTVKIGILAVFGPKPWTPPTPGRKRAPGLIRRRVERARFGRAAGPGFSRFLAAFGLCGVRAGSQ